MFQFSFEQSALRDAITAAYRLDEPTAMQRLAQQITLNPEQPSRIDALARRLVTQVRANRSRSSGVDALMHEFSLSSEEGIALMCLAEALLRIPDNTTRDKLIKDKMAGGDWKSHLNNSPSMFVNAAAWGLLMTGKLSHETYEKSLGAALNRVIQKGGEPFIRGGVNYAMKMLGKQFVTGQTIEEALANGKAREKMGYRFSFDMLGEAAMTQADADRYYQDYVNAIHAIGKDSQGRGVYDGNGISVKLSAIHPRYVRAQHERVMSELLPRLKALYLLAKQYNIGLNIDAEEANRLELSLDLMEKLVSDPELQGFNGIGFVVQAYQKRCPYVIDYLIDLARRNNQKLMIRLVKGAYWDSEIKWAQVDGMNGYPVYTRKVHTDIAYLACAKKLLSAQDAIFPQFASHNAYTLAAVHELAGDKDYEFQCLHGMGETLYDQVVGKKNLGRRVRIYAPVGTHKTLLAYLVRRLLENGANSSFVNRIVDENVSIDELVSCPLDALAITHGSTNGLTPLPRQLYGNHRQNSKGIDLSNEHALQSLEQAMNEAMSVKLEVASLTATPTTNAAPHTVKNPADPTDTIATVTFIQANSVPAVIDAAINAQSNWAAQPMSVRAACLRQFADLMEQRMPLLMMVAIREAGKTLQNAIAEVREAVDFCRFYADEAQRLAHVSAIGTVVAISPWNFPLAIFVGEMVSALVMGNSVVAKPAEQTSVIAYLAVSWLHEAGVPTDVLQLVLGAGDVGAALTQDTRIAGVIFTGSTDVAKRINQTLAARQDSPILIAETGGQNAMIIDSSALPEQVCADVLNSAFDSAGQRCSALRILCVQEDIADHMLEMMKGAMDELVVANPMQLRTDIGPVIDEEAKQNLLNHINRLKGSAKSYHEIALAADANTAGFFVNPIVFELNDLSELTQEVFGSVLHVVRFSGKNLDGLIDEINSKGYALTHGIHSRIDSTINRICARIEAGNIYVNRNIVGAVVGVQPFGGHGMSGTGPKAGGPFYLQRLSKAIHWQTPSLSTPAHVNDKALAQITQLLPKMGLSDANVDEIVHLVDYAKRTSLNEAKVILPGPTGEINSLYWHAPNAVWLYDGDLSRALEALVYLAANHVVTYVVESHPLASWAEQLAGLVKVESLATAQECPMVLVLDELTASLKTKLAKLPGTIRRIVDFSGTPNPYNWNINQLFNEVSLSYNTTAAGGNASLMAEAEI